MKILVSVFLIFVAAQQAAIAAMPENNTIKETIKSEYKQSASAKTDRKENVSEQDSLGRMLYANHCTNCHESVVHMRARRKAKNLNDLLYWVNQRADWLKLGWTITEKRAVMEYVNERYYKYPINQ